MRPGPRPRRPLTRPARTLIARADALRPSAALQAGGECSPVGSKKAGDEGSPAPDAGRLFFSFFGFDLTWPPNRSMPMPRMHLWLLGVEAIHRPLATVHVLESHWLRAMSLMLPRRVALGKRTKTSFRACISGGTWPSRPRFGQASSSRTSLWHFVCIAIAMLALGVPCKRPAVQNDGCNICSEVGGPREDLDAGSCQRRRLLRGCRWRGSQADR